ncbi:beta-ketoacyl-ACP synthase II [Hydrogenoanaerobacterium saccharovorans]|uniref:3-oxoacyl-[acyl-carrier-protein] synthase 2 n=1 Tax=Hydrogenoanaerobacterium saccharovorans TaxID=474960 RepID=A0ABS2GLY5_9FIRM|nr:beta-ketoacyl-ACP synthase II [Hydrogenoanaerobacterium saccharovorans]MBM6923497.1 beta-ketoacyl-ACP synthase II [Hydrogenoanaerobacterium saccharovorans]MBS5633967.1 beta-ketoacyl-ACP synthase II [Clostridiales bacterium]
MKRRVVITGMGAVSPIGNTAEEMWQSAREGRCGIGPITHFDTTNHKVKLAGEVKDLDFTPYLDKKELRRMDLFSQYAMVAAIQAWRDSGLDYEKIDPTRFGVDISSGIGGINTIETEYERGREKGFDRVSPFFVPMDISNLAAGNVAIKLGAKGMCTCVVTACAGGSNAIGDAFRMIRDGYQELMLAGGSEAAVTKLAIGGFTSMKALCESDDPTRASIPFDAERSGFVMGEGAGVLMLEEYEHARARGAKIYAEIVGYGATCDAYHITSPAPGGEGGARAMVEAVKDAGIQPEDIDYINAHGTSTSLNDKFETAAVKAAFGDHAYKLAMSSTKSMTGHLLGAAGAIEAIITARALQDGFIPATINYRTPDPECDLDIVPNEGRKAELRYAMSNSLGFGGHNASLVLKKYEEEK